MSLSPDAIPEARTPIEPRSSLGFHSQEIKFSGPTVWTTDRVEPLRTQFEGLRIETPTETVAVVRGGLTGQTILFRHNHETGEEESVFLPSSSLEHFEEAARKLSPQEQAELIKATQQIFKADRAELQERVKAAGGRDKFVAAEAQRLVDEQKYQNFETARSAVVNELEIFPKSEKAEDAVKQTASTGELPKDIHDPQEISRLQEELSQLAQEGNLLELARKITTLLRVSVDPQQQADKALQLAKTAMDKAIGGEKPRTDGLPQIADLTLRDAENIATSQLQIQKEGQGDPESSEATKYIWSVVAKLAKVPGVELPQLDPTKRVI